MSREQDQEGRERSPPSPGLLCAPPEEGWSMRGGGGEGGQSQHHTHRVTRGRNSQRHRAITMKKKVGTG